MFVRLLSFKSGLASAIMLLVCMSVTITVSLSQFHSERMNKQIMDDIALKSASSIVQDLSASVYSPLTSLSAIISADHAFGRQNKSESFHRYIETKNVLEKYPSTIAWSFVKVIKPENLDAEIKKIDNEPNRAKYGYGPIKVFPEIKPGVPIGITTMIAPEKIAKKVLGFNLLSDELRNSIAENVIKTGKMQISKRIVLKTKVPGVIMFSPVYKTIATPETVEARRENLLGFMLVVYATNGMFSSIKDKLAALNLDVDVHDYGSIDDIKRPELGNSTLIASTHLGLADAFEEVNELIKVSETNVNYHDIHVAGRIWRIVVRPMEGHAQSFISQHSLSIMFLVAGFLLSTLSAIQVYLHLNARNLLAARVNAKTRALTKVKKELEKSRDEAEMLSLTDALTGLANRRALIAEFQKLLASNSPDDCTIALAIMDIDFFKSINDTYGHEIGDTILTSFAEMASAQLKDEGIVCFARLGGDEFAILFKLPHGQSVSERAKQALLRCANEAGNQQLIPSVTTSIGIAELNSKDLSLSTLMRKADVALYEAKRKGRACYVKYSQAIDDRAKRKDAIMNATSAGLEKDEFVPAFHPYIDLEKNKIIGFEVLARWQHKSRGLLTPAVFWEALCEENVSTQISLMVMKKAFEKAGELKRQGFKIGRLGINVTAQMLENSDFAESFIKQATDCGLSARNVAIEVTERILLSRNTARISETLEELSSKGVTIAFDDFGTGYASLTHLRDFPIDCVKIDRSFVKQMEYDPKSRAIVSAVIKMAHDLNFIVVAEGTETQAQIDILDTLGCDAAQGFYYGKPVNMDEVADLLENNRSIAA